MVPENEMKTTRSSGLRWTSDPSWSFTVENEKHRRLIRLSFSQASRAAMLENELPYM